MTNFSIHLFIKQKKIDAPFMVTGDEDSNLESVGSGNKRPIPASAEKDAESTHDARAASVAKIILYCVRPNQLPSSSERLLDQFTLRFHRRLGSQTATKKPLLPPILLILFVFFLTLLYFIFLHYATSFPLEACQSKYQSSCVNLISKLSHAFLILDNFEVPKTGVIPAGCFRIHANKT